MNREISSFMAPYYKSTTERMLLAVFDQYKSQTGRVNIVSLLQLINNLNQPYLGSKIANTILNNIQIYGNFNVTDNQLFRLAQAVEKEEIDLNRFLESALPNQGYNSPVVKQLRGIVISNRESEMTVLLSNGDIRDISGTSYSPGIFIELVGSEPRVSSFEYGKDEVWLEQVWETLTESFENKTVAVEAFVSAGKNVRRGLVDKYLEQSQREDKLIVYKQIINY